MYKIYHILSDNDKVTVCNTDKEFILFTINMLKENGDNYSIMGVDDCFYYITEHCDNLMLLSHQISENVMREIDRLTM